jgi:signal transduction histidine kinase
MRKTFTICIVLTLSITLFSDAQPLRRLNSFTYNVNDGLLQSHVMDMGFDAAGFMWLSFETGLQRYDGHNFINIPVQTGLPENKYIIFLRSKNGLLWMFHSKGVSVYNGLTNKFVLVYPYSSKSVLPDVYPVDEDESIVYFYSANGMITGINANTLHVERNNKFPFTAYSEDVGAIFRASSLSVNHEVAICFNRLTLVIWNLKKGSAAKICNLPKSKPIGGNEFCVINNNECIYFNDAEMTLYNFQKETYSSFIKNGVNKQNIDVSSFQRINNSRLLLAVDNDLYSFDNETMQPLEHFVNFQNQSFSHFAIQSIRFDDFGNIYLLTRNEGFVKLLASTFPVSYYGSPQRESNFVACMEIDKKNNRVLAGALNGGLLVFDTLQKLQKHITQLGEFQRPGLLTISDVIHTGDDEYLLFPRFNSYCVLWNAKNGEMKKIPVKTEVANHLVNADQLYSIPYYSAKVKLNNTTELVAIDQNLYEVKFSPHLEVKITRRSYRTKGLCLYQDYMLTGAAENLQFLDRKNYSVIKEIHLPDCGEIRCITTHNNFIYAGCNRGLFKLNSDGKIISVLTKTNGLPDDYIYAVAIDSSENIWCSTNKGIIRINRYNNLLQLKKEDGLQENEFNTNVVSVGEDGELFFGGVNGINSFYPSQITRINDSPKIALTNIKVNDDEIFKDSAIWNLKKIILPYTANNLYFEFTALGKRNPEEYLYQYKIPGVNKSWIRNDEVRNARYVLEPGNYIFQVYAGKVYEENPKSIKTIEIIVTPPFWQTWWFKTLVVIVAIAFILIPIWQYNRRLYIKKLREMQVQQEVQLERERISRDLHDNLGAYAAAIAINVNNVKGDSHDSKMIRELQHNSQAIITQLNDTIWTLNREGISLTSISDRFKIFLQKIQPSYQQINISINESIETDFTFLPVNALHLFRIMQEAVNNAVRHSDCRTINVNIKSNSSWLVCIKDDGYGIKYTEQKTSGNGLRNMNLRASEAGWNIKWEDEQPKGTKFTIIPKPGVL